MRMVAQGHSFIVTSHSQPLAELRPLQRRRLINSRIAVDAFRNAPHVDHDKLREDLDEYISPEISDGS